MEQYRRAAQEAARAIIEDEALRCDPRVGLPKSGDCPPINYDKKGGRCWLHESSWPYIAEINRLGLITFAGQDAKDPVDGQVKKWERSYLTGFMPLEQAREFITNINLFEPGMTAAICVTVPDWSPVWTQEGAAGSIATNAFWDERRGRWNMRGVSFYNLIKYNKAWLHRYGLPEDFPLVGVTVIDTKWGRVASSKKGLYNAVIRSLTDRERLYSSRDAHPEWELGN